MFMLLLGVAGEARADNVHNLVRGTRAQGFGGAFTAVADDEQAIFYNPAGLAGIQQLGLQAASIEIEATVANLLSLSSDMSALQNMSGETINQFMGKNIYGRAQVVPSVVMPNFGFSLLMDGQIALIARNQALPTVQVGYQTTNGVQFAYGTSLLGRRAARRGTGDIRVGFAGKVLWRRGGYRTLNTLDLVGVSESTLRSIAGNYQMGYGGDLGFQWLRRMGKNGVLSAGLAWTDLGKFNFAGEADPLESKLNLGVASSFNLGRITGLTLALDYRDLLHDMEWKKKTHLGAELALPVVKLYAGLNQLMLSYGASFDLWLFKITAISAREEFGTLVGQDPVHTYQLKVAFKMGL